jgi:hypothetical protein
MLQQTGAIKSMARELDVDEGTAQTAASALLPAIVAGLGRSATGGQTTPEPLAGLGGLAGSLLGGGGGSGAMFGGGFGGLVGGQLLDAVLGNDPTPTAPGKDILGTIFGSKDVSRSVAGEVASATGLDENLLKKMLPMLAMAAAGYLAQRAAGQTQSGAGADAGGADRLGGILGSIVSGMSSR